MKKLIFASMAAASALYSGGYQIPESSLDAVALSAANVANAHGADAAYYNPANMVWNDDVHTLSADMTFIYLSEIDYEGTFKGGAALYNIHSEDESFPMPTIHYVSPKLGNARIGLSLVSPGGLTKRWKSQPGKSISDEFSLIAVELNPSVAIALNDQLAFAFGMRWIYSEGVVKSASTASRDMKGDSLDVGYNLALSYRPTAALKLAVTYRSNIDLTVEGDATLYFPDNANYSGNVIYKGDARVTVPIPAKLALAAAYTFSTDTTVEFTLDRTYWSRYKALDFDYAGSIGALTPVFDDPIAKNYENVYAYRIGITQELERWTLMAGYVHDESPIPDETLGFELPDSDGDAYSLGVRYDLDKAWNVGLAALYSDKESRRISNDTIDGKFSNASVYMISAGVEYKF
jgi:long-chain fatty acid transport protein